MAASSEENAEAPVDSERERASRSATKAQPTPSDVFEPSVKTEAVPSHELMRYMARDLASEGGPQIPDGDRGFEYECPPTAEKTPSESHDLERLI